MQQPKGTRHYRLFRKSTCGRAVPVDHLPARSWETLTCALPQTKGGHLDPNHPSRKHDVERPEPEFLVKHEKPLNRAMRRHLPIALQHLMMSRAEAVTE